MGEQFLPEGTGNSDGHFEDIEFFELHRMALRQARLADNGMVDLEHPEFDHSKFGDLSFSGSSLKRAESLVAKRKRQGGPFGWKEPRSCLFLSFYEEQLQPVSLILFRPYQEVVHSLIDREPQAIRDFSYPGWKRPIYWAKQRNIRRDCYELRHGFLEAWIHYNTKLLDYIERVGSDRAVVHDLQSIAGSSSAVLSRLRSWGFPAKDRPLAALIRPLTERENLDFEPRQLKRAKDVTERFREAISLG
jgi:hypothetical protein